ncbi:hypothetical protein PRZ01_11400 [Paucibacter sp. hw1]|uniref:Uncharacterized protein n=1 Tax=Roseateles koreensis TaxID=2987526 RepID=A0ABT5KTP3_9BURK|nr:hypothetical protein [Roseateles koreensis]
MTQGHVTASKNSMPALDAAQTQAARQRVARDERLADRMEQARLRQEARDLQRNGRAAGIDGFKGVNSAAAPSPCASNAKPSKGPKHAKPKTPKVPKTPKTPKTPKVAKSS